jgi:hypothetical protein
MSHVATIAIAINSFEALEAAAKRLGGTITEATTYKWYGRSVGDYPLPEGFTEAELGNCHFKINFANAPAPGAYISNYQYEVGIVDTHKLPLDHPARRAAKGRYTLLYDWFDPTLLHRMGTNGANLTHAYAVETTLATLRKRNLRITETKDQNGHTILEARAR